MGGSGDNMGEDDDFAVFVFESGLQHASALEARDDAISMDYYSALNSNTH